MAYFGGYETNYLLKDTLPKNIFKIALVSFGHTDVVLPLVKNLRENSVDIDLIFCFALNKKKESIIDFTKIETGTGFLSKEKINEIMPEGIKNYLKEISYINFFVFYNLKLKSYKNLKLSFSLSKKLKNYDIIHFNGSNGVLPILIFLLRKHKLIFTIHDLYSHSGEETRLNFAKKLNTFIIKSKYPVIIQNRVDYNLITHKCLKKSKKIEFIPFGILDIYCEFINKNSDLPQSDILFFGRISPYKGLDYFVEAIKILYTNNISLKTIIAGDGIFNFHPDEIERYNIKLINRYISNDELYHLLINTKVVVCPYTDASQSGVVMTAFAFKKPVIASDVGNFPEIVKNNITGFIIPRQNANALALKLKELFSHPTMLKQIEKNITCFNFDSEYSWQSIATKLEKLYLSVYFNHQ